jgi:ribokinase
MTQVAPIVVLGSLNMDLVLTVPRVPAAGETLTGQGFTQVPGGKGANQALACARMGARVALIGRVGNDAFGEQLRSGLAGDGVSLAYVSVDPAASTGVAMILVDATAENRIVIVPGANGTLTTDEVDHAATSICAAAMLIVQLETPMSVVQHAVATAHASGVPVLLNPAPAQPLPSALLFMVDYLVPNETEASLLTGINVTDADSAALAAEKLRQQGVQHVLITLGAQGVVIVDASGVRRYPSPVVQAIDTTAAGDTFIGAFAAGISEGMALDDAAQLAVAAAALSVTRHGAQTSIPYRREISR